MILYDLTSMQKSIWFTEEFYKNTSISNIAGIAMIYEKVNFDLLSQAINLFVQKNDSFKLKFTISEGVPKQYFEEISVFPIELIAVSNDKDVKTLEKELSLTNFEVLDSFLFKFKLFKFPDGQGGFGMCMHHLISDAWTSGLLVSQIMEIYTSLLNNQTPTEKMPSYVDVILAEQEYLNSNKFEKDKCFWEDMFSSIPDIATIPGSNEPERLSSLAKRKQFTIPKETMVLIKKFCKEHRVSEFNFFMSVLAIYIYNVSNIEEFVIGTPILNRTNYKEKHTTGMFISAVPLKISINPDNSFSEFVSDISSGFFKIFKHQKYPYQKLLTDLRAKFGSVPNLYNVAMSYQNMRSNANSCKTPYSAKWLFNSHISDDIDIHFFDINDTGDINIAYDYKVDKYVLDDIFTLHSRLLNIVNQVLSNDSILLKEIEMVLPDEKNKILYEFNNTKMDFPKDKTIVNLFEEQAEKNTDNIAVVFENEKLTYKELNERANSLAYHLRENGVCRNDVVAIMLNYSLQTIISILAVLKAGGVYLLIDTALPDDRISFMINNSGAKLVISNKTLKKINFSNIIFIEDVNFNTYINNLESINTIYDNFAIIYTSGSTGNPKGVLLHHLGFVNLIYAFDKKLNISQINNHLNISAISFDMFTLELFLSFVFGKTIYLASEMEQKDPIALSNIIEKNKIGFFMATPSKMALFLLNDTTKSCLKHLKAFLLGGEVFSKNLYQNLRKYTSANIYNGYGPTEVTACCSVKHITSSDDINIGSSLPNMDIHILNKHMKLCPIGTAGEICVSGVGIAKGYVNNVELTKKSFISNTFSNIYKTGDIGYFNDKGEIVFIGRNDSQLKINGLRIELSEIDSVISAFPNIEKAVTIYVKKRLTTYFKASTKINLSSLKEFAKSKLPAYMVPSNFTQLEEFPLSSNGKLDVKELFNIKPIVENTTVIHPRNNTEQQIFEIFASILQINNFGVVDDFFELGGDSLAAIKLSVELYSIFNVKISVKEIFENSSVSKIALLLDKTEKETRTLISRIERRVSYPLSSAQKRIYYSCNLSEENSILYNMPGGVLFDSLPDLNKLEKCLNTLIKRHESLRTYFEIDDNSIVQKIKDSVDFKLEINNEIDSIDNIQKIVENFVKPFDLSVAPLFRAKIVKLENNKVLFLVDTHHIISDGTSSHIFITELCKLYNGQSLDDISLSYKDFANFENNRINSGKFKEAENFWINQFSNDIPILNMPTTYKRPAVKSYEGSKFNFSFDEKITNKIKDISKKCATTPYMLLLSSYYILLSKYTSQEDIVVGTPIVGRNISELYNVFGMFVNILPIRANIDYCKSFKVFLDNVKNTCLNNYKYQDYPLDELVSKLNLQRDTSRNPLFDTMFIYQNNGMLEFSFDGINSTYYIPDTKISKFDLSLEIVPDEKILNLNFEYCTKLFNKKFIENLADHYLNIVNTVLDNLDIQLSDICLLSEKEKNKILYEFNNTKMDCPKDKTIVQLFEEQVEKTPNSIALVFEGQELTYKELNEKSNNLAHYLRNNGITRNDTIGIMVNRSLEMIIAILAVLKSGAAYIPIDPTYPKDRIEYMLSNSNAKLLLTQLSLQNTITFNSKICIDLQISSIYSANFNHNPKNLNTPDDPIYIIYTSGSTGLPKGMVLLNKNIVNFIYGIINKLNFCNTDTIISITTISFDIFVLESLLPLLNGMKIVIASNEAQTNITLLNSLCIENNVNIIQSTPSRMQALIFNTDQISFIKSMKYILIGGETFPSQLLSDLKKLSIAKIYNMYGPTETAVWSSLKNLTSSNFITIGNPIANTQLYVLDKFKLPLPSGIPGELYISGDGVGKGYLNNDELTKKVFLPNPFVDNSIMYKTGDSCRLLDNGEIEYLERIDNQVKIRGLRIELGEIEEKILSFQNIKKACVIKQSLNNRDFISAYFTATKKISINSLRKYLSQSLPKYMIPSYFTVLEDFPYTPNGKINKKVLPLPKEILNSSEDRVYVVPKTDLELKMVSIWEMILNTSPIGITDDFFELGGDSILAMNLNIELLKITDKISYADIFKFPTISKLIKKMNSSDEEYNFKYMEKHFSKYSEILENNKKVPSILNLKYKPCNNILLTGATGFLGIHILDSFLKSETQKIYCIVRPEVGISAQTKLYQKLNYYFGSKYDNLIGSRIIAISGDICKPGFGLSQENLLSLASNTDVVINSAARVSHYGISTDFYKANVKSVKYMLDFCKSFNKKFYQISTLSVSGNSFDTSSSKQSLSEKTYFGENNLYIGQSLDNVYIRSKFEAERLVLDAILDGLDAYILRMGNLMPRLSDGVFQENILENAYINRIISFIKLGGIPEYLKNGYLEFTPVDISANAIIKIITHPNKNTRIFHLFNHNHIAIKNCIKYFKILNSEFNILDNSDFKNRVKEILNSSDKKDFISSLINDFDKDLQLMYETDIIIKSDFTIKYLSKINFSWSKISNRYMTKFLDLLKEVL